MVAERHDPDREAKQNREVSAEQGFLASHSGGEAGSWTPWIVATAVVVLGIVVWILAGRRSSSVPVPGGTGMAPAAPYAANLPINGLEMSGATSFSGAKVTYVDGEIANSGNQTITAITVQVGFRNDLNQLAQRVAMPLSLIRTREPYVDTEPVSAAPLKPGDRQAFRLIFDTLPDDWNQQLPEVRIIRTVGH